MSWSNWSVRSYVLGFVTAVVLSVFVLAGGLWFLCHNGVTVHLDPEPMVKEMENSLTAEAETQISSLMSAVRSDLPSHVAGRVAGSFESLSLQVYGVEVPLPEAVILRMEDYLRKSLSEEVERWIDDISFDPLLQEITGETREQIYRYLDQAGGVQLRIDLPGSLSVPVRVVTDP